MVCIDHGVLLHHSWALSVVLQVLQQSNSHGLPSEEQRGSFTSHKPVSWELRAPLPRDADLNEAVVQRTLTRVVSAQCGGS